MSGLRSYRKAIPKKRAKKRSWKSPRCIYETPTGRRTCTKPQAHIERCKPHADAYLDALVRAIVVGDRCVFDHPFPHSDVIQPNHGIDRDEKSVRWNLDNVFSGCSSLNKWAYHHKLQWAWMVEQDIGPKKWAALKETVRNPPKLDYEAIRHGLLAVLAGANPDSISGDGRAIALVKEGMETDG